MKKIICFSLSIILSAVFIFSSVLLTTLFLNPSYIDNTLIFYALLVMCVTVLLMEVLNDFYDKADGFASKKKYFGRWVHNCCFLALLVCFVYAMILTLSSSSLMIDRRMLDVLVVCVCISVYLYFRNYRNLMSRKSRIRAIRKKQLRYKNRRYYYLVNEVKDEETMMKLSGILYGKIQVSDEAYIYIPAEECRKVRISKLSVKGKSVFKAKDGNVDIFLKKDDLTKKIQKYSVISSVLKQTEIKEENLTENPFVNGLIMGYGQNNRDPNYMSILLWEISSAQYLMAGKCKEELDGEITDVIRQNVNAAFPSVSTSADESAAILPVFTDWDALNRWKMLMEDKDAMSVIMKFEQIVQIMHAEFDGVVINPFGPFPFYMPNELANSLLKMHREVKNEK